MDRYYEDIDERLAVHIKRDRAWAIHRDRERVQRKLGEIKGVFGVSFLPNRITAEALDELLIPETIALLKTGMVKICHSETCSIGGQPQPTTNFEECASRPDGLSIYCRTCKESITYGYDDSANTQLFFDTYMSLIKQIPNPNEPLTIKKGA